jgi:hypothetical protein
MRPQLTAQAAFFIGLSVAGLTDMKKRWTREEQECALTLRDFGMTIQEVAWALGRSYSGTQLQLAKLSSGALLAD